MPIDQPVAPNRPSLRSTNLAHLCGEILAGVVLAPSGVPVLGPAVPWKGRRHGPRKDRRWARAWSRRSEEHTSELQSLMRISYAVFCLKKKTNIQTMIIGLASPR